MNVQSQATIRFYEELNDFLPKRKQKIAFNITFREHPSVKHLFEAEGVPHAEVDLVLINGKPVTFETKVFDGDYISVYPVFESLNIGGVTRVREYPLREARFILDVNLGKLARYLRMMGFDAEWYPVMEDSVLAKKASAEKRCILTRDKRLLMHKVIEKGIWIRHDDIRLQVREVINRLQLESSINLFSRCTLCNGYLEPIDETEAFLHFPGFIFPKDTPFGRCRSCHKIYWLGSHCERFRIWVAQTLH